MRTPEESAHQESDLFQLCPAPACVVDSAGLIAHANRAAAALFGAEPSALRGQDLSRFILPHPGEPRAHPQPWLAADVDPARPCERPIAGPSAPPRWVRVAAARTECGHTHVALTEITGQIRRTEARRQTAHIIALLDAPGDLRQLMASLTEALRSWSGCEAVGIRLHEGEDFPYYETRGFPTAFVRAERSLCAVDSAGTLLRDANGNTVIECMCGNVLCGRTDPALPFFTELGSFWTNSTTELLASTSEKDRQSRTRNRCNHEGYESVALVPLHEGAAPFGLIQFNDRRPDRFSPEIIAELEHVAIAIANGLTRRRAQDALRETRERLELARRAAGAGTWDWDIATGVVRWSPELYRLVGLSPSEVPPSFEAWVRLLHPEDREAAQARLRENVAAGDHHTNEYRVIHADGSIRWIESQGRIVCDPGGAPIRVHGVSMDITERKRTEEALRETETRFRGLFHGSRDAIVILEPPEWRFTDANPAAVRMFGAGDVGEVVSRSPADFSPERQPDGARSAQKVRRMIESALRHGSSLFPWTAQRMNGEPFPASVLLSSVEHAGRHYLQATIRDITDQRLAEEALRQSEERHRLLFENHLNAVAIHEIVLNESGEPVDYVFLDANPSFETQTGLRVRDVIGRRVTETHPGIESTGLIERYGRVALTGEPEVFEVDFAEPRRRYVVHAYQLGVGRFATVFEDITERTLNEAALRNARWRLASILEGTNAGTWEWNIQSGATAFNEAWAQIIGYTLAELAPCSILTWEERCHPDDLKRSNELLSRHFAGETPFYDCETRMRHRDGRWVWVHDRGRVITRTEDGRPLMMFGTHTDITERKRTEEALRESEERFAHIAEQNTTIAWEVDSAGLYTYVSGISQTVIGYSPEELVGRQHFYDLHPSHGREAFREAAMAAFRAHAPLKDLANPIQAADGRIVWVTTNGVPILNADGSLRGYRGSDTDITERRAAEASLRIELALELVRTETLRMETADDWPRVVLALDHAAHSVLAFNMCSVNVVDWDASRIRLHGIAPQGGVYCQVSNAIHPAIRQAASAGRAVYRPNRRDPLFDSSLSPEVNSVVDVPFLGGTLALNSVHEDAFGPEELAVIARFAHVLSAAHRRLLDLEALARHARRREELEAQLRQAMKMEAVGRLAGGMAHDFNNMLGVILGHAELGMLRASLTPAVHGDLETIRAAAERSTNLTRQLLAFARKQAIQPRGMDLNYAVGGMLDMLRRLIGENITLDWRPGHDLWPVFVDPSQIDQILANLCVNARDAISGVGRLDIATFNHTEDGGTDDEPGEVPPGDYVRITVRDTGAGMDEATLSHLFEPFFTTKEQGRGTGLGLATVYGAVMQNHGHIRATSRPGEGATFTIDLPRHRGAVEAIAGRSAPELPPPGKGTILLVEDEPAILELARAILEDLGYTVLAAALPSQALALAREHGAEIDLLLTDVIMPEMDGTELARRLQADHPGIARVFMSGYPATAISSHGVLNPDVYFIQKPFTLAGLASKVREAMESGTI